MKKSSLILTVVFLFTICFSASPLLAQESTASQKEKDDKLQQAIDLQKKALLEEKKAQDLKLKELEKFSNGYSKGFWQR